MNFFVEQEQIKDKKIYIKGMDVNHIKNVLRYKEDTVLNVVCKTTNINYKAKIEKFLENEIECEILEKIENIKKKVKIDIYQGLPKADKMELIIQKCSEIGVNKIVPVAMRRCVVKLDGKDATKKKERWQTIAEVAAKQCMRDDILEIEMVTSLKEVCKRIKDYDIVLVAYEKETNKYLKEELEKLKEKNTEETTIAFVVGPEGGFEESEVQDLIDNGAKSVSLGKRILRTETAPIVVSTIIMYEIGDIGG